MTEDSTLTDHVAVIGYARARPREHLMTSRALNAHPLLPSRYDQWRNRKRLLTGTTLWGSTCRIAAGRLFTGATIV